jgi:hypothetical protein
MSTVVSVPVVTLNGEPVIAVYLVGSGGMVVGAGGTTVGAVVSLTVAPFVQVPVLEDRVIVGPATLMDPIVPEASAPPPTSTMESPAVMLARLVLSVRVSTVEAAVKGDVLPLAVIWSSTILNVPVLFDTVIVVTFPYVCVYVPTPVFAEFTPSTLRALPSKGIFVVVV